MKTHHLLLVPLLALSHATALAQLEDLQITEVLFNPAANPETRFEWVEVRNTGTTDVDLDGYVFRDVGDTLSVEDPPLSPANILSTSSGGQAANTVVPAGAVAVLYNGPAFEFDDDRFRAGWNLPATVPMVAVEFYPSLNNAGDARQVGLWADAASWELDSPVDDDVRRVSSIANAARGLNYTTDAGFPGGGGAENQGRSITWTGQGDASDGANWVLSAAGVAGATTSVDTFLPGDSRRNGEDIGSPNAVPAGAAAAGLLITEIMVDPGEGPGLPNGSGNNDFEWVEILNNTGAAIDFGTTNYVLSDPTTSVASANVTDGSVGQLETAVLFDDGNVTTDDMQTMWGPGNYIPVSSWPALNNGGDTVALWDSLAAFESDEDTEGNRTFDNAAAVVPYADGSDGWPAAGDGSAIYLTDLDGVDGNGLAADGSLWGRSTDDFDQGVIANPLTIDGTPDYLAGDTGSPGTFVVVDPDALPGDFNGDGTVDAADYTVWRDNLGSTASGTLEGNGDETGDSAGVVDQADYALWKANFGAQNAAAISTTAVPEPTAGLLMVLIAVAGARATGRPWSN